MYQKKEENYFSDLSLRLAIVAHFLSETGRFLPIEEMGNLNLLFPQFTSVIIVHVDACL